MTFKLTHFHPRLVDKIETAVNMRHLVELLANFPDVDDQTGRLIFSHPDNDEQVHVEFDAAVYTIESLTAYILAERLRRIGASE